MLAAIFVDGIIKKQNVIILLFYSRERADVIG